VVFTDGASYDTPATITDPSTDPDIATESFSFNDPPAQTASRRSSHPATRAA
jgi:hypothetical protein